MADGMVTMSDLVSRLGLSNLLGRRFGGKRELYDEFGWPKTLTFDDFLAQFSRNGVARRIIDLPVEGVWNDPPSIVESGKAEDEETEFERQFRAMADRLSLWNRFKWLDRMARLGEFSVLLLGFPGSEDLSSRVGGVASLAFARVVRQDHVSIREVERDRSSPRFGLPVRYQLDLDVDDRREQLVVHHSRVIHVAEDPVDNLVTGTPALKPIFNFLLSLEMVIGSSGEMYWRSAFPGRALVADSTANLSTTSKKEMQDQIEEYEHGLRRFLRLQGVNVQTLGGSVSDPSSFVGVLLDVIAGSSGIPKRLLVGSERGDLASTQDKATLAAMVASRKMNHAEPMIVRPFIDKMIALGVLPAPRSRYEVDWPDSFNSSQKEKNETIEIAARALRTAFGPMTESIAPRRQILEGLGFDVSAEDANLDELEPIGDPPPPEEEGVVGE